MFTPTLPGAFAPVVSVDSHLEGGCQDLHFTAEETDTASKRKTGEASPRDPSPPHSDALPAVFLSLQVNKGSHTDEQLQWFCKCSPDSGPVTSASPGNLSEFPGANSPGANS